MERPAAPIMRSKLFVPGSRPELFPKAAASAADALSFDLEDAVAPTRKAEARAAVADFLRAAPPGRQAMVVRVNGIRTPLFAEDVAAVALPGLHLLNLPMVQGAEEVREAAAALARAEAANGVTRPIGILCNIETPRGLRLAHEIAAADPRVVGLQIGYGDLFEPHGIERRDAAALAYVRMAVKLAAAEVGVACYDGAWAKVAEPDAYHTEAEDARRMGYAGKSCIHPTQIAAANEVFRPSEAAVAKARRIVAAAETQVGTGTGAFLVEGDMVDAPFIESARALIALAERLDAETTR